MGILFQNKKVGLALLCDNAPYTLAMTLASYGDRKSTRLNSSHRL